MASSSILFWSNASLVDLDNILVYLESRWTTREAENFKAKLFKRIDLIQKSPKLFKASKQKPELRRSVLSKQTSIFYSFDERSGSIYIIRLFDNRMNPDKL